MEGTRNERAVLVVLAYVIGFTTAYIAITHFQEKGIEMRQASIESSNHLASAGPKTAAVPSNDVTIQYGNGELVVHSNGDSYLVSVEPSVIGLEATEYELGLHTDLPVYKLSPDGNWLHFCEVTTDPGYCRHNLYDMNERVIRRVQVQGEHLVTSVELAKTSTWNSDTGLKIGPYHSEEMSAPWEMHAD